MKLSILIVDDEKTIREVIKRYLDIEGFNVLEAESGLQAINLLLHQKVDLVVLDIMLPELDGYGVARRLRDPNENADMTLNSDVPIIFLTARKEEHDRLHGFELGGDDYLVKPFSTRELVARVKAVIRRSNPNIDETEAPITLNTLSLDPRSRTVVQNGKNVSLTAKEFDLLWFLARHPRQVFSRTQLLDNVWGYDFFGDDSTVTVHVRRLREKIEPDATKPTYIQTVWGIGYKLDTPET